MNPLLAQNCAEIVFSISILFFTVMALLLKRHCAEGFKEQALCVLALSSKAPESLDARMPAYRMIGCGYMAIVPGILTAVGNTLWPNTAFIEVWWVAAAGLGILGTAHLIQAMRLLHCPRRALRLTSRRPKREEVKPEKSVQTEAEAQALRGRTLEEGLLFVADKRNLRPRTKEILAAVLNPQALS